MPESKKQVRFSLILLLVAVVAAAAIVRVRQNARASESEIEAIAAVRTRGGWVMQKANGEATFIDLTGSDISDADLAVMFGEFANLQRLLVANTEIGDAGLKHIATHSTITSLDLGGTRITDAALRHIGRIEDLEVLTLNGTSIGDAGLQEIRGLKNLYMLHVAYTKVTPAGVRSFKAAMPNCVVKTIAIGGPPPTITQSGESPFAVEGE